MGMNQDLVNQDMFLMDGNSRMKKSELPPLVANSLIALVYCLVKMNLSSRPLQKISILILSLNF